jgi:single-stranded-DNA-specific exonuclease
VKPAPRRWAFADAAALPGQRGVLGAVLAARGVTAEAAHRLAGGELDHHDPLTLRGMPEAVVAVGVAISEGRRLAVYGDYDADGVTACALLTQALRAAGADVVAHIPNRMAEGYGLHAAALAELHARGVECVVTVDCGTSGVEVAAGRPEGLHLVITDHHLAPAPDGLVRLPEVDALVNPKQPGETYPFDALAGAGVAWKLVEALEAERVVPRGSAEAAIALAALGTVADMMPLRGENRSIVTRGLAAMAEAASPGLQALLSAAGVRGRPRASDLAFSVAPRLNAAGRMEDAELALRVCLAPTVEAAAPLAEQLCAQNEARKLAVARALAEAEARVAGLADDAPAIVLGDPGWPMGIVGLVAGRLAERYARPTFIACLDAEAKGSARSVRGVHLVQALDRAAAPLLRYGGHAAAAGFSLDPARWEEFSDLISAAVAEQIGDAERERVFRIDATVELAALTPALAAELAVLEPCGQGNPEPLLAVTGARVLATTAFGAERQHLRVLLGEADSGPAVGEAIAFNKPGLARHLPQGRLVDVLFALELDRWEGIDRVRLRLRDLRPARAEAAAVPAGAPERAAVA